MRVSKIRKIYFVRLFLRCLVLVACVAVYFRDKTRFRVIEGWQFFRELSPLHVLWGAWMLDMLFQLIPARGYISLGSQKHFLQRFRPITERINYPALKRYITSTTKSAYKVFLIWAGVVLLIAALYWMKLLGRVEIFLISVLFYVCDLVCVLIWCPFRLIMKNRCCTTCRIFNWDHLMMFSPMVLIPGFYTSTLLLAAIAVWIVWEGCVMLYPERFWEITNAALRCDECTDKLCTQYCRKLRKNRHA